MLTVEFARMNKEFFFRLGLVYASIGPGKNHLPSSLWLVRKKISTPALSAIDTGLAASGWLSKWGTTTGCKISLMY